MKTIEDRAMEYSVCQIADEITERRIREAYIKGATEQQRIDDAEHGKELLYVVNKTTERVKKERIDEACDVLKKKLTSWIEGLEGMKHGVSEFIDIKSCVEEFRKAMEE